MRIRPFFSSFTLIAALALLIPACNGGDKEASADADAVQTETPAAVNTYTFTGFDESVKFPDASIDKMSFKKGNFDFSIGGATYKLGEQTSDAPRKMCANSAEGQHLHIIVNDNPYDAKYTPTFEYQIPDGEHYVLAFLSRSYHESIKTAPAHRALKVQVKDNSFVSEEPISQPMLFYSRPKGTYVGKEQIEKVMLDFYLVNATLGQDYKVQVDINAEQTFVVDAWRPYYIEGLPLGDNKIKLTLLDKEGNPVASPYNPVERVFTLLQDPLE